ncbi:LysR family transcriptional regulator [Thioalkalivibrio sulfidiphilus]|uniref:LysR family transcriptional regulator n=1 Tax=Thioalkalivibrio sulfidiphilus TaxID=1033854 RepID=UPI0003733EA9|nr:LysR family transcriptional regulator [Thioalkalivibrio sulfidiphilus]
MDLDNLSTFLAVAEARSFSAAAERLHLTQPAVSKRVAALEGDLGQRLFDRIGRQVSLTEAGRVLLPQARRILADLDDARRTLENLSHQVAGPLWLATSHHVGLHRLPPILKAFTRHWPDVDLHIRFMESEEACRAVAHGDVDLAVVTLPVEPEAHLEIRTVWADPLVPVVASDHPLVVQARPDLNAHDAILPPAGTFTRGLIDTALAEHGIHPRHILETPYLETIRMLVSIGLGWSLLPETLLDASIQALPLPGLRPVRRLGSVVHHERTLSNAAGAMLAMLPGPG